MAKVKLCFSCGFFLLLLVAPSGAQMPLRFCAQERLATSCRQMAQDLPETFQCVVGRDMLDCARKIHAGEADLANMEYRALFVGGKDLGLVPIAAELVDGDPHKYAGIALVLKDSNISSPSDLRGRRSCHTGVGRTVGWQIPLAVLFSRGIMDPGCEHKEHGRLGAVEAFFGGSCAPGKWSIDPIVDKELKLRYPGLCRLCEDPASCSSSDGYSGYFGAMQCLLQGAGEVAFTKVPALLELLEKDPAVADRVDLLCLDGGRKPVIRTSEGRLQEPFCVWGTRPTNAFVTSEDGKQENEGRILAALEEARARYPPPHVRTPEWYHSVLFSDESVMGFQAVGADRDTYSKYLGDFLLTIQRPWSGCEPEAPVRFCVTSEPARRKCEAYTQAAEGRALSPVACVVASSQVACMEVLKAGHADLIVLDGGDVYKGGKYYDLQPVAGETYDGSDASYFAVAVIRSASDVTKLSELRGLRSCHTGMGRTAGWVIPVGVLLAGGELPADQCNRAESMADFFDGSCLPGANDTKYNPNRTRSSDLCRQCVGNDQGEFKCARSNLERFSGYSGALRCLADGKGDVAFVKHTTVPENTDGSSEATWAKDLVSSDFQLLCSQGGTSSISDYTNCNLAKVPSHFVMTSGSATRDSRLRLAQLLADSTKYFGDDSYFFRLMSKFDDEYADLLFKDSATALKVAPLEATYADVLGETFLKASEAVDPKVCVQS